MTINDVADYIIYKSADNNDPLNLLKLQKLAYYAQAWHLALYDKPLAPGARFQAWAFGPVSRTLYDRFHSRMLYNVVTAPGFDPMALPADARSFMDAVLEEYGSFGGSQLEYLTRGEEPWTRARGKCAPMERCETEIDESVMAWFYRGRTTQAAPVVVACDMPDLKDLAMKASAAAFTDSVRTAITNLHAGFAQATTDEEKTQFIERHRIGLRLCQEVHAASVAVIDDVF